MSIAAVEAHAAAEEAHIKAMPGDAAQGRDGRAEGGRGRRAPGRPSPRRATAEADDLQRIKGVGPVNEKRLRELGIFHFDQIAAWTRAEIRWVGTYLSFPGRIDREAMGGARPPISRAGGVGSKDERAHAPRQG